VFSTACTFSSSSCAKATFGVPAVKKEENAKGIADAAIATFFSFLRKLIVSPSLFNFLKWKINFCPLPFKIYLL